MQLTKFTYVIFGCRHRYRSSACTNSNLSNHTIWCFCFGCSSLALYLYFYGHVVDRGEFGKMQIQIRHTVFVPNICVPKYLCGHESRTHTAKEWAREAKRKTRMKKPKLHRQGKARPDIQFIGVLHLAFGAAFESATTAHNMATNEWHPECSGMCANER